MTNKKEIYNSIKRSFESSENKAPDHVWNNLSKQLDTNINIDNKIKESFENNNVQAPGHIWNSINKQLNINNSWEIIKLKLNRQTYAFWFRVVAIILILLALTYYEKSSNSIDNDISYPSFVSKNLSQPVVNSENNKTKINRNHSKITKHLEKSSNNKGLIKTSNKKINKPVDNSSYSNPENDLLSSLSKNILKTNVIDKEILPDKLPPKHPGIINNDYNFNIDIKPVDLSYDDYYYPDNDENGFKYEIGITYSLENTWLLNNETRKSFDKKSLISAYSSYTNNYGLTFSYYFDKNNILTTELFLHGKTKQEYGLYDEGKYFTKSIELSYHQLSIFYQYNINQLHRTPTAYTIKTGVYISAFTKKQSNLSNYNIARNDNFSKFDYGLKLAVGHKNTIRRFTIEYGVASKYGIKNIFKGNEFEPSDFNKMHLLHFGGYINLSYKF